MGFQREIKRTVVLAFPIVISQVSQHLVQVIDSAMIGQVGVVPLAAAAFASSVFVVPLVFGFGITVTTSVLAANAFGKGDLKAANHVLRVGLALTTTIGVGLSIALWLISDGLEHFNQPEEVVAQAKPYFNLLVASLVPVLIFSCFKNYAEALSRPWMPLIVILLMLAINVFFNWLLIFGNWGFPELGLVGAGWATLAARSITTVIIVSVVSFGKNWSFNLFSPDWLRIKKAEVSNYLSLAIPSAFQIIFEVSAFVFAAIMMGWISEEMLAAHQIAINVAGTTFMVTLGISFATSVRVGQYFGRQDYASVRMAGLAGWVLSASFMTLCMVLIYLFRDAIPVWFVDDRQVILITSSLLVVAALFQVFDGIQIAMISGLRGMLDVRIPTVIVMIVYYGICLPLAYYLGFVRDYEGVGIWGGLAFGLFLSASLLSFRFFHRTSGLIRSAQEPIT